MTTASLAASDRDAAVRIDRLGIVDRSERRVGLDVDLQAAGTIEQAVDFRAHRSFECGRVVALGLRLPGHDQARRIRDRGFERLAGKEHQRGFHDGEHQREKWCRDDGELDRGSAVFTAGETPQGARVHRSGAREPFRSDGKRSPDCLDHHATPDLIGAGGTASQR